MAEEDQLHSVDWVPIPNAPYIMKYVFCDAGYNIMISNLTFLYSEKLAENNIQERFSKLNPFAVMKSQVIVENLRKSLEKCLTEKSDLSMKFDTSKLMITLKFPAAHVICSYDIEMNLMEANMVMHYIIGPTVFGALLSQWKVLELQKKILSVESTKSSLSSNSPVSSRNTINPEWLKGQNVCIEAVLDSFLKIQSHFKDLYAESYEACSLRKEKTKPAASVQSGTLHKKHKFEEIINDESTNVKFEDAEENTLIKEEKEHNDDASLSQPVKDSIKKKKIFKI